MFINSADIPILIYTGDTVVKTKIIKSQEAFIYWNMKRDVNIEGYLFGEKNVYKKVQVVYEKLNYLANKSIS